MESLKCTHCGAPLPGTRSWAQAAVSALMPAPAVADMSTQVRCDACGRVSAASELRPTVADRFRIHWIVLVAAAVGFVVWLFV